MKTYLMLLTISLLTATLSAQRQAAFECVGDNGKRCECVYDKRWKRLEVSCGNGFAADFKRNQRQERVIVRANPQRKKTRW
jgi:hypothetical protein